MDNTRIEKDSLGELPVPSEALYGIQTQRAVLNFPVSGLRPWRAFVWSVAVIKRAAAEVNLDLGQFAGRARSDGRPVGRPVCGGPVPGRGRHLPQHERE